MWEKEYKNMGECGFDGVCDRILVITSKNYGHRAKSVLKLKGLGRILLSSFQHPH